MAILDEKRRQRWRRGALVVLLALPGSALAGLSVQGLSVQGLSVQGLSVQGLSVQGLSVQGLSVQGLSVQGLAGQGVALMGTDLLGAELAGVDLGSVEIRGTTADSPLQPFELTSGPGVSTGAGDYIAVGGASAVGHYAVGHLVDPAGHPAEDIDLYIAAEAPDPAPNLLHRGDDQTNADVTLYTVFFFHKGSGQWVSLCPFHGATGGATAMAIAEDPSQPNRFVFACTATGVAAKCARGWGYRPWRSDHAYVFDDATGDWVDEVFAMKPFYDACKVAARAAYCQDRQSFTRNGTLVDLFDTRQLVWPNAIENPFGDSPDSQWMLAQEFFVSVDPLQGHPEVKASALQRTRYRELSPVGQCADFAFIDRLEQDHFEDNRWASPLTSTPRIQVFSPNYCVHNEREVGVGLPWDCSPCTTSVCKTQPRCCRLDQQAQAWDALCVAQAVATCDAPPGRVWPRDGVPAFTEPPQKYLLGPFGAVERVDRTDPPNASSVTISGWACDAEWPGAVVSVSFYGGAPPEQSGSTLLGTVYADQALAAPLAREVGAACDGPGRTTARHGFSFAVPADSPRKVFIYALDSATTDGPAAPPTRLRNGLVSLPPAAGGARLFAAVTTGWIEAPASGTYTFSTLVEPSRLFVNGHGLVDGWTNPGLTAASIALMAGAKYHVRWDRLVSPGPADDTGVAGVSWLVPGAASLATIPPSLLYRVAPGRGRGLAATYFDTPGFAGRAVDRLDPVVDVGPGPPASARLPDGLSPSAFSVSWRGEIIPRYSDSYTFIVTSAGVADLSIGGRELLPAEEVAPPLAPECPHDICALGDKLTASTSSQEACHPCVDQVCAGDPFCCNGGYLSYYSQEPAWDAKCVAEVGAVCGLSCKNPLPSPTTRQRPAVVIALQAGARYPIRLAVASTGTADPTTQLLWQSARQERELVPTSALFPEGQAEGLGAGLNVATFSTRTADDGQVTPDLDTPLGSGATPDLSTAPPVNAVGLPLIDVLAAPDDATLGVPPPPAVVSPRSGGHHVDAAPVVSLTVLGGVLGGSVHAQVLGTASDVVLPFDADGNLRGGTIPVGGFGAHTLRLTQRTYRGTTCAAPPASIVPRAPPSTGMSWWMRRRPLRRRRL